MAYHINIYQPSTVIYGLSSQVAHGEFRHWKAVANPFRNPFHILLKINLDPINILYIYNYIYIYILYVYYKHKQYYSELFQLLSWNIQPIAGSPAVSPRSWQISLRTPTTPHGSAHCSPSSDRCHRPGVLTPALNTGPMVQSSRAGCDISSISEICWDRIPFGNY